MFEFNAHSISEDPDITQVDLQGYLDAHAMDEFKRKMQDAINKQGRQIVLNTADLNYISSSGMGLIMQFSKDLREHGGDLILLPPPRRIASVFELLGFNRVLRFVEDTDEAIQAFSETPEG